MSVFLMPLLIQPTLPVSVRFTVLLLEQGEILMELWRLNSGMEGKNIKFRTSDSDAEIDGQIIGIRDDGGIKIKISDNSNSKNISTFYSGEISFIY